MKGHSAAVERICSIYGTDEQQGLSNTRYGVLLQKYGENAAQAPWLSEYLTCVRLQLKNVLTVSTVIVFAGSVVLAGFGVGSVGAACVTGGAAMVNILLGAFTDFCARRPLARFQKLLTPGARAVRDGQTVTLPAAALVPGDVILLCAGERVPADARLTVCEGLVCDEAALTGKSTPIFKRADLLEEATPLPERVNMVHMGGVVTEGSGRAIVTATGMNTELAACTTAPNTLYGPSAAWKLTSKAGVIASVAALLAFAGVIAGALLSHRAMAELFTALEAAAIVSLPLALPAATALALQLGTGRLAKSHAAVKNTAAAQTLARTTVLCTGMTGTLTQGVMEVKRLWAGGKPLPLSAKVPAHTLALLKLAAMCCKEAEGQIHQNPAEAAILDAAMRNGLKKQRLIESYPLAAELPFTSGRGLMTTIHMVDGVPIAVVKGTYYAMISRCTEGVMREEAAQVFQAMCGEQLRVVAVAYRQLDTVPLHPRSEELEQGLTLAGLIGMTDPLRADALAAVRDFAAMDVKPVLLTGDDAETAYSVAARLEIVQNEHQVLSGADIASFTDDELSAVVGTITVYSGISAYDKARVVKAWQKKGHTVLAIGGSLDDLPALEAADTACCVAANANAAVLPAADVVLAQSGLSAAANAVRESRILLKDLKKPARYLAAACFAQAAAVAAAVWLGLDAAAVLRQVLFIGLIAVLPFALALGAQPPVQEEPHLAAHALQRRLFSAMGLFFCAIKGLAAAGAAVGAYMVGSRLFITDLQEPSRAVGAAMFFLVLLCAQPFLATGFRSESIMHAAGRNMFFSLASIFTLLSALGAILWGGLAGAVMVSPVSLVHLSAAALTAVLLGAVLWGVRAFESLCAAIDQKIK